MKLNSRYLSALLGFSLSVSGQIGNAEALGSTPWRLHDALSLPSWLTLGIEHRTRYETLNNQFRAGGKGGDQVLAFRTNVSIEAAFNAFRIGAEFMDARIALDDKGTPVDNTLVNTTDILQLYGAWITKNFLGSGLESEVKLGRQTMDLGSRRLVVRNNYRNTVNAFTGLQFNLIDPNKWQFRLFIFQPVPRLPDDPALIREGRTQLDTQDIGTYFGGVYYRTSQLPLKLNAEAYYLHLDESDSEEAATRNRRLYTPGFRIFKSPAKGEFDSELESVYQFGTSRLTTSPDDTKDLNHFAFLQHGAVGYTFNLPWSPRFLVQYDYASGGQDNTTNHRFDTLFGGRRFELGPASILSAFARTNINSPGYRFSLTPHPNVSTFIGHRLVWLADAKDAWTTAILRDKTGSSGNFLGNQIEASVTWQIFPKNLTLETGCAFLIKGDFAKNALNAPTTGDTSYFYAQTVLQF
jgi:Alginate export